MAPVTVTSAGVSRQVIDDPELTGLMARLAFFAPPSSSEGEGGEAAEAAAARPSADEVDVEGLCDVLSEYPSWRFQEQVSSFFFSLVSLARKAAAAGIGSVWGPAFSLCRARMPGSG